MIKLKYIVVLLAVMAMPHLDVSAQSISYFNELGFTIIKSDNNQLMLSYKPVLQGFDTIITSDGTLTLMPQIKGGSLVTSEPGSPASISITIPVAIPGPDKFHLTDVSINNTSTIAGRISPMPDFAIRKDVWTEVYEVNPREYYKQTTLPKASLNYAGISRDIHLGELTITAAYFNSLTQSIEIPKEIYITITFDDDSNSALSDNTNRNEHNTYFINNNTAKSFRIESKAITKQWKKETNDKTLELSTGNWIKITVKKEGIYKIDASSISSLGFNIPKDQINTIKIFGNGGRELSEKVSDAVKNIMNEQAIIISTGSGGDLQSIVFYGAPTQGFYFDGDNIRSWFNHYSDENYYLLTWGGDKGRRAVADNNADSPVINRPNTYTKRLMYKEELTCALVGGSGRIWFGGSIFPRAFSNELYNLDRSKDILYRFAFSHRSSGSGKFSVSESGKNILAVNIPSTSETQYLDARERFSEVSVSPSIIPADNRSLLNITYENPNIAGSTPFFNWYELHYSRNFTAVDNTIEFWTDIGMTGTTEFTINGFNGSILGFDVSSSGQPKLLENEAVTGGMFVFKYDLDSIPKRFFISSKFETPDLAATTFANLREKESDAEVILITPGSFRASAEKYQTYRSDRKIEIINVDDIFNEFNAGVKDPTAIRDFIAFAMQNRAVKPKYVIFWGDGHYDYKNIQSKIPNHIITYQSDEKSESYYATSSYTTDDYFAWVVGNDRYIDVSISRIPINSDNDGKWMVDKIKFYEKFSSLDNWRTSLTMIADDSPTSNGNGDGSIHVRQSEILCNLVVPDYMINNKIYLPEYPSENIPNGRRKPRVTEEIVSYTNNHGSLTMNWVGHGNPRVWAHEEIFDRDKTISQFKNLDKLFFNTAATCDFARFDMPETKSGAEELLLAKNGGSIGEFSSTRVVYSYDNARINETFYRAMFTRDENTGEYLNLGDVMYAVKQIRANSNDIKYNLFADPLLKLQIPYYIVRVETINSQPVINPLDTAKLKGMSKVDVVASIINPVDSTIVSQFNGFCNVTMLDADYNVIVEDVDGTNHAIKKYGGALNRGSFPVTNGKINVSFYLPEDVSFIDGPGRLYIYAYTENRLTANGVNRQFKIVGVDSLDFDASKPLISIFLDSNTFKQGDIVSSNPMLIVGIKDEYGVNTSGSGIGHRLEAWIDDNPNSIDLTYKTNISPDDPKVIEARQLLTNLSPGTHKVKIRAWNVFNKYSVEETYFRVLSGDEGAMLWDVSPYPNPFSTDVTLRFRHNLSLPFDAVLSIYDIDGGLVKQINTQVSSVHTSEIRWDGTDIEGNNSAQGIYLLQLEISTYKGKAKASAGAALIR